LVPLYLLVIADANAEERIDLTNQLQPIREEYHFPALAAGMILEGELRAIGVVGVRKHGSEIQAELDDPFHLGSCTKAMTASLIARLVNEEKLRWDQTLAETFPEWKDLMHEGYRRATLVHLLSHRAGAPKMTAGLYPLQGEQQITVLAIDDPRQQRLRAMEIVLLHTPLFPLGENYEYSNFGYTIAGAMAEKAMDESWESLMRRYLFEPLDMKTAGFGAMGTRDTIDAPWQHTMDDETIKPINPGPNSDNPDMIAPAGLVHCSIEDWAKYIQRVLKACRDEKDLLPSEIYREMMDPSSAEPPFGENYALGWELHERKWGAGTVLTHAGSNGMNFSVVWIAPKKNFAVLVAVNRGGKGAPEGVDKVCEMIIEKYLTGE
jgi:CubicO group peptidase (beta-lactamase class C family)